MENIDMNQVMGMVSALASKVDMSKLKNAGAVKDIKIYYQHTERKDGKGLLRLNLVMSPNEPKFSESFLEILKLVLASNPNLVLEFEEVED